MNLTDLTQNKPVSYSAVVLDEKSKKLILKHVDMIPEGWRIYNHHSTIMMGGLPENWKHYLDMIITMTVDKIGISEKGIAVGVNNILSRKKIPHITVAVNTSIGGKPMDSDNIKIWTPIEPFDVTGTIQEI